MRPYWVLWVPISPNVSLWTLIGPYGSLNKFIRLD